MLCTAKSRPLARIFPRRILTSARVLRTNLAIAKYLPPTVTTTGSASRPQAVLRGAWGAMTRSVTPLH